MSRLMLELVRIVAIALVAFFLVIAGALLIQDGISADIQKECIKHKGNWTYDSKIGEGKCKLPKEEPIDWSSLYDKKP